MSDPGQEHRRVAGRFLEIARSATPADWDGPSPVEGWSARGVVGHLIDWFPPFLSAGTGVELPEVPKVEEDPVAAWAARMADIQELLDQPGDRVLRNPHIGAVPLAQAIDQFYTADVFMHTWDLARALGVEPDLDPDRCAAIVAGSAAFEDAMRSSGQYGPRVVVPDDASPQDKLVGFIGRDPSWRRPAR
jgi:uncharacterized protein (TIGR03086 family)